jgi:hypothetical protein
MPVRTREVELDGEWEGWNFTARTNPPIRVLDQLQSDRFADICGALGQVIRTWNFVDERGDALPGPEKARERARAEYQESVKNGGEPDPMVERVLADQAASSAVAVLPFDLVLKVSESLSRVIAEPEKN